MYQGVTEYVEVCQGVPDCIRVYQSAQVQGIRIPDSIFLDMINVCRVPSISYRAHKTGYPRSVPGCVRIG